MMDFTDNAVLVSVVQSDPDDRGIRKKTEKRTEVWCSIRSVSSAEFFEGGRNGLQPQFQVRVPSADYDGQTIVELNGIRYAVYRTYVNTDETTELYLEMKGGTNESKNQL